MPNETFFAPARQNIKGVVAAEGMRGQHGCRGESPQLKRLLQNVWVKIEQVVMRVSQNMWVKIEQIVNRLSQSPAQPKFFHGKLPANSDEEARIELWQNSLGAQGTWLTPSGAQQPWYLRVVPLIFRHFNFHFQKSSTSIWIRFAGKHLGIRSQTGRWSNAAVLTFQFLGGVS